MVWSTPRLELEVPAIAGVLLLIAFISPDSEVATKRAQVMGFGVFFTALFLVLGFWLS